MLGQKAELLEPTEPEECNQNVLPTFRSCFPDAAALAAQLPQLW